MGLEELDLRCSLDEALVFLAAYPAYLDREPGREAVWRQAVAAARKLDAVLARPPEKGGAADELFDQVEGLSEGLRENLKVLRQPLEPGQLSARSSRAGRPAGPAPGT